MKSITVCLSTYNGEKYLKPLLDSVLNQQEVKLFLYVRDDGSTDSTRSILKEYDKTHANMHITEGNNIGYVQSFWSLLSEADQSDYYAFCDQDDIWQPNKCIEAIKRIETQPGSSPVLYTSNVKGINEKGEIISEEVFPLHRVLSFAECLQRGSLPGCTFIFNEALRKQAVKYNGPQISHDWTLYIIAKATGTVLYDQNSYLLYRLHQDNTIGLDTSKIDVLKKKIHRFIHNEYKQVRSSIAAAILKTYAKDMRQEDIETATVFSQYASSLSDTFKLMDYEEYRNINFLIQALTKKI